MVTKPSKSTTTSKQDRQPELADVSPPYRGNDYKFEYQALFDIQKSIGQLISSVDSLKTSSDSTKAKVDDLIGWKNKILGAAFILGLLFSLLGFAVAWLSKNITINPTTIQTQQPQQSATPQSPQGAQKAH